MEICIVTPHSSHPFLDKKHRPIMKFALSLRKILIHFLDKETPAYHENLHCHSAKFSSIFRQETPAYHEICIVTPQNSHPLFRQRNTGLSWKFALSLRTVLIHF